MNKIEKQNELAKVVFNKFGATATNNEIADTAEEQGMPFPHFLLKTELRVGRGQYRSPLATNNVVEKKETDSVAAMAVNVDDFNVDSNSFTENLIPEVDPLFVSFGNFATVRKILDSKMFYPVFVTGMSGNGKTFGIEQACAKSKREVIRVNFTVETDEDDLIGGFRLVKGETKFFKGPVIKAMEMGAVLLLDEIDLGNPAKIMCLQSILEGKGYFIKKTGEYVKPAKGFTAVATANTKGKGSDDGRFIGTNILNEAFLERFPITVEQEYPSPAIEKKILSRVFASLDIKDNDFVDKLVDWADIIRKTFYDGGVDEIISTRRLVHVAKAFSIFDDRMKAINLCINRFDEDTKLSFADLYTKIDAGVEKYEDVSGVTKISGDAVVADTEF
jgi:MoxR-like ATPase